MSKRQQWILTVDPASSLDRVSEELVRRRFAIASLLREIGVMVVTGTTDSKAELAAIPGVTAVEPETAIDIGPPGQPGSW